MLWNARKIHGYHIKAADGPLGTISDFLFDDVSWTIRWLVVDTGHWLPGRKVLLPTFALGHLDADAEQFSVLLTKAQVEASPNIETHQPVSRQMEVNIFDYYGWSPDWGGGYYMGGYGAMSPQPDIPPRLRQDEMRDTANRDGDPHLRSVEQVTGYHIHATDGDIGHVQDFLIGDVDWSIHYLVVDTQNWLPGQRVLISPRWAAQVDWIKNEVTVSMDREALRNSPKYDDETMIDRAYEQRFHRYYDDLRPPNRL